MTPHTDTTLLHYDLTNMVLACFALPQIPYTAV